MKSPHLLMASSNARQLQANLRTTLDPAGNEAIDAAISANTQQILSLATEHLSFAVGPAKTHWRQRTSRLYFAAYSASRSLRLFVDGAYVTDPTDHRRAQELPPDFPERHRSANLLDVLRGDRNLADYDHTATEADLVLAADEATAQVTAFVAAARTYLHGKGLKP